MTTFLAFLIGLDVVLAASYFWRALNERRRVWWFCAACWTASALVNTLSFSVLS